MPFWPTCRRRTPNSGMSWQLTDARHVEREVLQIQIYPVGQGRHFSEPPGSNSTRSLLFVSHASTSLSFGGGLPIVGRKSPARYCPAAFSSAFSSPTRHGKLSRSPPTPAQTLT